jgi:hypothetical protein
MQIYSMFEGRFEVLNEKLKKKVSDEENAT